MSLLIKDLVNTALNIYLKSWLRQGLVFFQDPAPLSKLNWWQLNLTMNVEILLPGEMPWRGLKWWFFDFIPTEEKEPGNFTEWKSEEMFMPCARKVTQ